MVHVQMCIRDRYKAEADGLLYAGKITDAKMEQDRSLHLLQLEARCV